MTLKPIQRTKAPRKTAIGKAFRRSLAEKRRRVARSVITIHIKDFKGAQLFDHTPHLDIGMEPRPRTSRGPRFRPRVTTSSAPSPD
jgi:hypothetical protein